MKKRYSYRIDYEPDDPTEYVWLNASSKKEAKEKAIEELGLDEEQILAVVRDKTR